MNIPNDASISRTHATFEAHAEAGGVTVCDTSKFGVHVDGVRLDPKNATGDVVLRGEAAPRTCAVALGCAKPAAYEAKLVYTPSDAQPVGGDDDDDATTDGDETDAEDRAVEGAPEPTNAEDENETETRRAAPAPRGADAAEGKATTVFEPLPERARPAADASVSAPNLGQNPAGAVSSAVVDFKRSSTDLDPRPQTAGRRHGGWFSHHRDQRRGRPHHPLRRRLRQERRPPRRPGTLKTCLVAFLSIDASRPNVERLLFSTYGHLVSRNNWRPDEKKTRRFGSALASERLLPFASSSRNFSDPEPTTPV